MTQLLSEPERLSPTLFLLDVNSSLTFCIQTELTFPRLNCVKNWPPFTRLTRTLFLFSVSELNTVVVNPLVSVWSTTPLLTWKNSNQLTDWLDTVWPKRVKNHPDNKEDNVKTDKRRSLVLVEESLSTKLRDTLTKLVNLSVNYVIIINKAFFHY